MTEVLRLSERIDLAREIGESHFREFKSGLEGKPSEKRPRDVREICSDIGRTLVAFANSDGGELFVGIEDNGVVTGLNYTEEKIETLLQAPKTHVFKDTPLPSGKAVQINYQNKNVLYFSVPKGTDYIYLTADGRCLQRKDLESVPISAETITFTRTEKRSREYDREYIDGVTTSDLDIDLIQVVAERISKGMSAEKCLQHLELAEFDGNQLRCKRAALLLFAKNPSKWHPRLQVRILKVDGTEIGTGQNYNVISDEEVGDNIVRLVESSWELLRPHLTETRFSSDAVFRTQIIYPELACREALINAIAHRDYSSEGQGIEVQVFNDRLNVISPGGLLSSITIEDLERLEGVHQSRNSLVARVLREIGYMRELGEGIRRIYELMSANDLTPPNISANNNSFIVTLYQKYIYTKEEKVWLSNFSNLTLDRDQKTVVRLGLNGRLISASEIYDAVGIVDTDYYRQLVESLRSLGILENALTKNEILKFANSRRIPKKKVPRYRVLISHNLLSRSFAVSNEDEKDDLDYAEIFVGNVPFSADEESIIQAFSPYGEVVNVVIPRDRRLNRIKGFAFVEFASQESANQAIQNSGSIQLEGRNLYCQERKNKI